MLVGEKSYVLHAEKENLFFSKERDLTFESVKTGNVINKMLIYEHGEMMETVEKQPSSR